MTTLRASHRSLLVRTALASGIVAALPAPALAQSLPQNGVVQSGGAVIDAAPPPNTVKVDLNGTTSVINWESFNIGAGKSVKFTSTDPTNSQVSVLNRVVGTGTPASITASTIDGTLDTANGTQKNITFWLMNPAGITFGSNAAYNGAGLVLSTLEGPETDFANVASGAAAAQFATTDATTGGTITINGDLSTSAGDLIILAKNVTLGNGLGTDTIGAAGNLVVVAANSVNFGDIGSPLSFTVGEGAAFSPAANVGVEIVGSAEVSGQNVTVAAVSKSAALANILKVDNGATLTATASGGGVVTLATNSVGTVTVDPAAINTFDGIDFHNGSTIKADNSAGAINLAAAGNLAFDGNIDSSTEGTLLAKGASIALDTGTVAYGSQTYDGPVTLGANTTITGAGTFKGTVDSDGTARSLTVSGAAEFDGAVGGAAKLSALTASNAAAINGGAVGTTGDQVYSGAVTLGGGVGTTLTSDTGRVTFSGTVDSADATARDLTVDAKLTVAGNIGSSRHLGNFEVTKATRINAVSIATDGTQTYDDTVVLGGNASLTGSMVRFASTVDSVNATARNLTITGNAEFDQDVGTTRVLKTISVSGDATLNAAQYKTTGNQTYGLTTGTAATLGADATFTADTGTVAFGGTLDGAHTLVVTGGATGGNARFGGQVGNLNPLTSVTIDGTAALDGGLVKTTADQTYNGAVTIGAGVTLAGGAASTITFNDTVNSSGGAQALTTNSATVFNAAVGGASALSSYQANGDVTLATDTVKTVGDQTYAGTNLNLTGDTTLTSTSGTVKLQTLVNNPTLDLAIVGNAAIDRSLGDTPLRSLSVSGSTAFEGTAGYVKTTGGQTYSGPVTLANDIALTTTLGGTIGFGSTVDSLGAAHSLTLDSIAAGALDASFGGAVGGTLPLSNLTINQANTITATSNITTNNTLALDAVGAISVAGLTSNAGNVLINQTSPSPGSVTVNGPVSTAGDYMLKATTVILDGMQSAPGKIEITATTGDIVGGSTLNLISNSTDTATTNWLYLDAGNGTITLDQSSQLLAFNSDIGIRVSLGANVVLGGVSASSLGEIDAGHVFTPGLTTGDLNNLMVTSINLTDPIDLEVAGDLVLGQVTTPANVTLAGKLVSLGGFATASYGQGFDVTATAGDIILSAEIHSAGFTQSYHGPVVLASNTDLTAATVAFDSTVDGPPGLSITGNASFGGAVGATTRLASLLVTGTATLTAPTIRTVGNQTFSSAVVLFDDVNLDSSIGLIRFAGTVDSDSIATPRALDISGNAEFDAALGASAALGRVTVSGTTALNGGSVTTINDQTYHGTATLGANTALNAGGGVAFDTAVINDATPRNLTINAAEAKFFGSAGTGGSPLANLFINGATLLDGASIFAADQTYNGPVALGADAALTGTNVTFVDTVDGPHQLTVNASTTFDGAVNIGALTVGGPTVLNGNAITTTGAQSYLGPVTLGNDNVLTGSLVDFASTLDGAHALSIAGDAHFADAVGSAIPLTSLTVSGSSLIDGPSIATIGAQTFDGSANLAGDVALSGSAVTFNATLDSATATARDLTIAGQATFNQAVGGTHALGTLTTNNEAGINGGAVTTAVAQNYLGNTTLGADATLTSLQVLFASALDSSGAARDLTIMGDATFDAAVGATLALKNLDVSGKTLFNGPSVTTTETQSYGGPATLGTNLTLTGGAVRFGSTLDGPYQLAIAGDAAFDGAVGSTSAPLQLTVNAPGAITSGSTMTVAGPVALTGDSIALAGLLNTTGATGTIALTSNGATTLDSVDSSASLTVNAGTLDITNTAKAAGPIDLSVAGAAQLGAIDGQAGVTVHAGSLTVTGAADAAATLDVTTTGATHLGSASSGGAMNLQGDSITVDGLATTLNPGSALTLTSTGLTKLDSVASNGALTVNAGSLDVAQSAKAAGAIDLTAGSAQLDGIAGGAALTIHAGTLDVTHTAKAVGAIGLTVGTAQLGAVDGGANVTATGGSLAVTGATNAIGTLAVTTTGATHLGSASSGGAMTIHADSIAVDGLAATLDPGSTLELKSTGATTLGDAASSGALTVDAGTLVVDNTARAAGPIALTVGGTAQLGAIDGHSDVTVSAGSLAVSGATTAVGTLDIATTGATHLDSATSGGAMTIGGSAITVDHLLTTSGGPIALTSSGATMLDRVDSGAGLTVNAGSLAVSQTAKAAGDIGLTVAGTAQLGAIDGGANVTVGAGSLSVSGAADAAGALALTTTDATHLGSASAGGPLTIHAGSIAVDGLTKTLNPGGTIALTSAGATALDNVDSSAGLTIASDTLNVAHTAKAAGQIDLTVADTAQLGAIDGGAGVTVHAGSLTVGGATDAAGALDLTTAGATHLNSATSGGAMTVHGNSISADGLLKTTGATAAMSLNSTGATQLDSVDSAAGLSVNAGTLNVAQTAKAAGAIALTVGGAAQIGAIDGGAGVTVGAGSLTVTGATSAVGTLAVTTTGATHLASASSGGAMTIKADSIAVDGLTTTTAPGSAISLTSAGTTQLDSVDSSGSLTVDAGTLDVTHTAKAAGAIDITAGAARLDAIDGGATLTVHAGTLNVTNTAKAAGAIDLTAATAQLGGIDGGANVTAGGGSLSVTGATNAAGTLAVTTTGATHLASASSGGAMTIKADSITVDGLAATLNPGSAMALTSTGATSLDTVDSNGSLSVDAGTLNVAQTAKAAGAIGLTVGGAAQLGAIDGGADVTVDAGSLTVTGAADAAGTLAVTTTGATHLGSASSGGAMTIHADSIKVDELTTTLDPGSAVALTSTDATTLDDVASGGALTVKAGSLDVAQTAKAAGTIGLTVGGAAQLGAIDGGASVSVDAGSLAVSGATKAAGTLNVTTTGATHLGSATTGGATTIHGATITVDGLTKTTGGSGTVALTSTGATTLDGVDASAGLTVNAGSLNVAHTAKAAGAIALTVGGAAQLGAIDGGAGVTVNAGTLSVGGAANAGGTLNITTPGASHLGSAKAGGVMNMTGSSIAIDGLAKSGGAMALGATGTTLGVGSIDAGGDVTLSAKTTATLGSVTASGHAIKLSAADADLKGTVTASKVTIVDQAGADHDLNLGDGAGSGGFGLSTAEINRIAAPTVVLDAGTGTGLTRQNIAIGSLDLTNSALTDLSITGLQRIDMTGGLKAASLGRLQLGGTAAAADLASVLRVAAKADGTGGLIDIGQGSLDLRAATIGIGQDTGFLDTLGVTEGKTAAQTAEFMVSNANSALYNPVVGGGSVYTTAGQHLIVAGKLTVSYANFALVQNTAAIGGNEGVVLASATTPATPALAVSGPNPPDGGPFALFGNINGKIGNEAALLGPTEINMVAVDRTTARINGCVVGSGTSCLNSSALSTTLANFSPARTTIIFVSPDLESPFDPLIATNNDSLFGDVGTVGLGEIVEPPLECEPAPGQPCPTPKEGAK